MLDTVYTEIAERIAQLQPTDDSPLSTIHSPLIKWIDLYNAQPEFLEQREAHDFPAVFVEFAQINWSNQAHPIQQGDALIRLHVVQWSLASSYEGSENQGTALERLQLLSRLHAHLHGFAGSYHTPMIRTATLSDTRHDAVTVDILEYRCLIYECPEQPERARQYVQAALQVRGEIAPQVSTRPAPPEPYYQIPKG
jgi:hypothetical protein